MSLFSILNKDNSSTSSVSTTMQLMMQQIAAKTASGTSSTTDASDSATTSTTGTSTSTSLSDIIVSMQAQQAATEKGDANKDAAAFAKELRTTLDAQYKKSGTKDADMSAFSGRGLATVALNENGSFSNAEVAQAKSEMRERDRQSLLSVINSGPLTSSALATYGKSILAARTTMSAEERSFRDAHPNLR